MSVEGKQSSWKLRRFLKEEFLEAAKKERNETKGQILTLDEWKRGIVKNDKMQGRPIIIIKVKEQEIKCLIDTCVTVNVISWKQFLKLDNVQLDKADDTLRCANDSTLETKAVIPVQIASICLMVKFTIVQHMYPGVIGGIGLQQQFGIELNWSTEAGPNERQDHICNIEEKIRQNNQRFGKVLKSRKSFKIW